MISFSVALVLIAAMKYQAALEVSLGLFVITGVLDLFMVVAVVAIWKDK